MKNMKNNNTTYGIADLLESDMGDGLGFRRNIFDGVTVGVAEGPAHTKKK